MYAHIIRQLENELTDWSRDFSEIETLILIKYIKTEAKVKYGQSIDSKRDVKVKYGQSIDSKRDVKKDEVVYFCSAYERNKCSHEKSHFGKFRSTD
jgi:hypothetical protein